MTLEKTLPHSAEAERAVLGAILLDNDTLDQAAEMLKADDFYVEGHRTVFSTMLALSTSSKAIDSLTLREELLRRDSLEAVGGVVYIASLLDGVPRVSNLEHYANIIREKSLLRRLVHSANEILVRSFSDEEDPGHLLEAAEHAIFEI